MEPGRAEAGQDLLDLLRRGGFGISQLILHPKPLPLETAELMEWQHIHALDVSQPGGEISHSPDLIQVIRPAGHNHEPNPGRPSAAARRRANACTGWMSMPVRRR